MKYLSLFSLILLLSCIDQATTDDSFEKNVQTFQTELNQQFADSIKSPMDPADREVFTELEFFPINEDFLVKAKLKRTPEKESFEMRTNTPRLPEYKTFGIVDFELMGKSFQLEIYQNQALITKDEYKDYLFLPYTDVTNGNDSYGGGRYIDLKIPEGDELIIDFNQSYNPYCAYSARFSCPIPPSTNDLNIRVEAGVKAFGKTH